MKVTKLLLGLVLVGGLACGTRSETTAPTSSSVAAEASTPSAPPAPLTLDQKVDQLLVEHLQIKYDVCSEYKQLVAVGWSDEMARGLLIGEQGIAMLSKADVKLIEGVGDSPKDPTKVVDMLVARCS